MSERQKTPRIDSEALFLSHKEVYSMPQHHGTAEASFLIAQDMSKATSVGVDDMLRFFVAQIVLDKTKSIKDRMPETTGYLEQVRGVVKPIVAASQSTLGGTTWGSPEYLRAQLRKFLATKTETEGYEPWVNLTNTALHLLKTKRVSGIRERNTEDDIIMQRTDLSHLDHRHNGSVAGRKPDIAFIKLKRAQDLNGTTRDWYTIAERAAAKLPPREERSNQERIDREPKDAGFPYFGWSDVLFFSEHKSKRRSPKSLRFEDLLVLEKLRAPVPPSPPGQSFPMHDLRVSSVPSQTRKRSIDQVLESSSDARRSKSQKMSADGTASLGFKNSQHISPSHTITEDAACIPISAPITEPEKLFAVNAGNYGLRRLNSWFGMTHSLGCLVLGPLLYICWFDREGLVGSSAIDVSKDLESYIVLLFILQRFKDDEWGQLAALSDSTIHILNTAWKVDVEDILHKPQGMIGRNTTVIGCSQQPPTSSQPNASAPSIPASDVSPVGDMQSANHLSNQGDGAPAYDNKPLIYEQTHPASHVAAEDSTPSPSSVDESQTNKDEEEGHAGRVEKNSLVVKFSWIEKTRIQEHEVYRKIEAVAQSDDDVKGHVPDLVAHHVFHGTSTSIIRDALGSPTPRSRLLIVTVFNRLDGTIRDLSGAEYWKVYWETFLCHYGLWTQGVYHRDISDGNLMYRKDKGTGEVIGVLADFDLSSLQGNDISNTERTGTLPFMALNLLSKEALAGKVKHDYCHEAEAFFWVGVYDTACYDNGRTVDDAVPAEWNSLGTNAIASKKFFYLSTLRRHIATPAQKDVWGGIDLLTIPLKEREIFERPEEPDPNLLSLRKRLGRTPKLFDPSVQEPNAVRDHFLLVKRHAEELCPSLLKTTSTSSS